MNTDTQRPTITIPAPAISTGPKGMTETEAAALYLSEMRKRTGSLLAGSGVTALVNRLFDDVIDALKRPAPSERYRIETAPAAPGLVTIVRNSDNRGILGVIRHGGSTTPHFADKTTAERILAFLNHDESDTPRPERVTLTDDERRYAYEHFAYADDVDGVEEAHLGKCFLIEDVERILAAREQALRDQIAGQIEATTTVGMVTGYSDALDIAARIARGDR